MQVLGHKAHSKGFSSLLAEKHARPVSHLILIDNRHNGPLKEYSMGCSSLMPDGIRYSAQRPSGVVSEWEAIVPRLIRTA